MAMEEGAKAVSSFLDTMKTQPLALALVVLSFALIGLLYYQSAQFTAQRRENVALFVQVQRDVQKLLSECIIPVPQDRRGGLSTPSNLVDWPPKSESN